MEIILGYLFGYITGWILLIFGYKLYSSNKYRWCKCNYCKQKRIMKGNNE